MSQGHGSSGAPTRARGLAWAAVCGALLALATGAASVSSTRAPADDLLLRRRSYHERYTDAARLVALLDGGGCQLRMANPSATGRRLHPQALFPGSARLRRELAIAAGDPPARKAHQVFRLVQGRTAHRRPLYEGNYLHHPAHFLSTYAAGFCDDAASATVELARAAGIPARTAWIEDEASRETVHVVAELLHDGDWRVYDPDLLGILHGPDGGVATFPQLAALARRGRLDAIPGTHLRARRLDDAARYTELGDPWIELLPGEERRYLAELLMLGTDGVYSLKGLGGRADFLQHYGDRIANYVRIVPLSAVDPATDEIEIRDYFPIAGAFLVGAPARTRALGAAGQVLVESDGLPGPSWRWAAGFPAVSRPGIAAIDLSSALKVLEPHPSFAVQLRGVRALLRADPGVRLVTVHPYARVNADFSPAALADVRAAGIEVQACP